MSAEHKRPLVAFILVALVCSSIVGTSVRSALLGNGIGLGVLIPITPAHLLDTIQASGANGRYLDTPFLGSAIDAVADVPAAREPQQPAPSSPGGTTSAVAVPAVATPAPPASRARPTPRAHPAQHPTRAHQHPRPRVIGEPPVPTVGPVTLGLARTDLRAARIFANHARLAALGQASDARACVRREGKRSCKDMIRAAQEAQTRAVAAAEEVSRLERVVLRLLDAIDSAVAPVRTKATQTFVTRVENAKGQLDGARVELRSESETFFEDARQTWSQARTAFTNSVERAVIIAHQANDRRLREVRDYAKKRQATVRHINHIYEQKLSHGNVAAARAYRKAAFAALAVRDRAFAAKIAAERAEATAVYTASADAAREALDRTRAQLADARREHDASVAATMAKATRTYTTKVQNAAEVRDEKIADAQAAAEASVVIDPATVPVDLGQGTGE